MCRKLKSTLLAAYHSVWLTIFNIITLSNNSTIFDTGLIMQWNKNKTTAAVKNFAFRYNKGLPFYFVLSTPG